MTPALIIAAYGRQYRVRLPNNEEWLCYPRGKKSELACGDIVKVRNTGKAQGIIEGMETRRTLFYRANTLRQKLIAANVDQVILVAATEPAFSGMLINRCLIAAQSQGIAPLIVLNKCDLTEKLDKARESLSVFVRLGYLVIEISAHQNLAPLRPFLDNKMSVLVGQSGMGKSTIINTLIPGASAATREISATLDSGKHTTTHTRLYSLNEESHIIDSPGLQEFGLEHLDAATLEQSFPEFAPYLNQCRFRNCRHRHEPGCAVREAAKSGHIQEERLALFHMLTGGNLTRPEPQC